MATPMTAAQFVAALKKEGVKVSESYSGWRTHNRNHVGAWGPVNGVLIHHTAGSNSHALVYNGRSDLPGPLAHTHLAKDGTARMMSAGRANHAGPAAANAFNALVAESKTHPAPSRASGTIDGNARLYGIEIENLGNGKDPYPAAQYDAAVRWAAAICRHHGWSEHSIAGHKETSVEGKIDPSFNMNQFRADVAKRLAGSAGSGSSPTTPEDDDMPVRTSLSKSTAQSMPWGKFTPVKFNKENADPKGQHANGDNPGFIPSHDAWADHGAYLRMSGLEVGDQVQVRYELHNWKSGKSAGIEWSEIVIDQFATPGDDFLYAATQKHTKKGQHLYVSVKPIAGSAAREKAAAPKVTSARWTIRQDS